MNAAKTAESEFHPEYWLKLYAPSDADGFIRRFKAARVHVVDYFGGDGLSAEQELEAAIQAAFNRMKAQSPFTGYVARMTAHELGLTEGPMLYDGFRKHYLQPAVERGTLVPCEPWKIFATAMALAEDSAIYTPEFGKLFCFEAYADKKVHTIESEAGWYWLHRSDVWSHNVTVFPKDSILVTR